MNKEYNLITTENMQGELIKNEIEQNNLKLQAFKEQKFNELLKENNQLKNELREQMKLTNEENLQCSKYAIEITSLKEQRQELRSWLEEEKNRLARECSQIYEDSLGKTRLVNEDIFNEVHRIISKLNELEGKNG